jgi:DNA-directed RNA polymerase subunit E'/Rpb7
MYHTVYLDERIALTPSEINSLDSADGVKKIIRTKLRAKHEGKCNANGYVRPDSVELLARSMGVAENGRFTGNLVYDCKVKCEVIYPVAGSEMLADVIKVNSMGAYATFEEAIQILLPRDIHLGNLEFDKIKENDKIRIRIERSRFQANDQFIMAVGVFLGYATDLPAVANGAVEPAADAGAESDEEGAAAK